MFETKEVSHTDAPNQDMLYIMYSVCSILISYCVQCSETSDNVFVNIYR